MELCFFVTICNRLYIFLWIVLLWVVATHLSTMTSFDCTLSTVHCFYNSACKRKGIGIAASRCIHAVEKVTLKNKINDFDSTVFKFQGAAANDIGHYT